MSCYVPPLGLSDVVSCYVPPLGLCDVVSCHVLHLHDVHLASHHASCYVLQHASCYVLQHASRYVLHHVLHDVHLAVRRGHAPLVGHKICVPFHIPLLFGDVLARVRDPLRPLPTDDIYPQSACVALL